jgi:hypothetical protein
MKKRISIRCLLGFIFSLLGWIALSVMQVLGEGPYNGIASEIVLRLCVPIYIGIVILEIAALILSITGVVTAVKKRLKLRGLGIAGIAVSAAFLIVFGSAFLFSLIFRESPPVSTSVS